MIKKVFAKFKHKDGKTYLKSNKYKNWIEVEIYKTNKFWRVQPKEKTLKLL